MQCNWCQRAITKHPDQHLMIDHLKQNFNNVKIIFTAGRPNTSYVWQSTIYKSAGHDPRIPITELEGAERPKIRIDKHEHSLKYNFLCVACGFLGTDTSFTNLIDEVNLHIMCSMKS